MNNVPYDEWALVVHEILSQHSSENNLVLDLACGTGTLTEKLANFGHNMIGIDNSLEMLEMARRKKEISGHDILYLHQDMKAFELYGTVKAIVCLCDSINYILEPTDLKQTFTLVNNYLDPKGLFIFDFNTTYKYREIIGKQTIAENREDKSFIWENYFHEEERINELELSLFVKNTALDKKDALPENSKVNENAISKESDISEGESYRKFKETHYQRAYDLEEIKELIKESGLEFIQAFDGYTKNGVTINSERILLIASESGK